MRIQDPAIERVGRRRPYFRIRITKPVVNKECELSRQRVSEFLGFCDETTLSVAKQRKQMILAALNCGPIVVQSQLPFPELVKRYKEVRLPQLTSTTRSQQEYHIRNHIEQAFAKSRLIDIDRYAVEAWLAGKSHLSVATRRSLRHILAAMFERARDWRLWDGENPCSRVNCGRGGAVREKRYISPEQIAAWLAAIPDTAVLPAHRARLMAEVGIVGGLRVSESCGLQPQDIDLQRQTVSVRRRWSRGNVDQPKTERSRRVVFVGDLAAELLAGAGKVWVFEGLDGNPPDDRNMQFCIWRPAAEACGIYHAGFGLHTMRRLAVTWAQEAGLTPIEAMRRAGHSSLSMTALYTLESTDRQEAATQRIVGRLRPQGGVM
jgi:integrase